MSYRIDEIAARYRNMDEGELLELAAQKDQLTPEAQAALEAEIESRGLANEKETTGTEGVAREPVADVVGHAGRVSLDVNAAEDVAPGDYLPIYYASSESEAQWLQESLNEAGIDSQLQIVLCVTKADSDKAGQIISAKVAEQNQG